MAGWQPTPRIECKDKEREFALARKKKPSQRGEAKKLSSHEVSQQSSALHHPTHARMTEPLKYLELILDAVMVEESLTDPSG